MCNHISWKVFDMLGKEVATVVNEMKIAGIYFAQYDEANLSSGVKYYK